MTLLILIYFTTIFTALLKYFISYRYFLNQDFLILLFLTLIFSWKEKKIVWNIEDCVIFDDRVKDPISLINHKAADIRSHIIGLWPARALVHMKLALTTASDCFWLRLTSFVLILGNTKDYSIRRRQKIKINTEK